LLDDMCELVRDESLSGIARGIEVSAREYDVAAHRVGVRMELMRGARCALVGMDPHATEVVREARFHRCAGVDVERTARSAQRVVHDRWDGRTGPSRKSLHGRPFRDPHDTPTD
jgi:hypothetical protein